MKRVFGALGCRVFVVMAAVLTPSVLRAQAITDVSSPPAAPSVKVPIAEGMRTVSGAQGPGTKPTSIEVLVTPLAVSDPSKPLEFVQRIVTQTIGDDGSFTVTLNTPLVAGQHVTVCARGADGKDTAAGCHDPLAVETADDWGRVRAYFAGGMVFSKQRADFSQQDMAMSFTLDKTWAMKAPSDEFKFGPQAFNSFFDTRLTSVPVGTGTTTMTSGTSGGTSGGTQTVDEFINSQKALIVQAGFYVPLFSSDWTWVHDSQRNAVFLAPVFKTGVITAGGSNSSTTTPSGSAGGTTTVATTTTSTSGVYKFIAFGFGVGHETLTASTNSAPTIMSYLHTTFGKWENFPGSEWRIGIEGRLKIPTTPFQIGFDANVPFRTGDADLRFTLGARMDIGSLLAKLKLLGA